MRVRLALCLAGGLLLSGAVLAASAPAPKPADVLNTYGDLAQAMFENSLNTAKQLQTAVNAFLADPAPAKLASARPPGNPRACPICKRKPTASATTSWMSWEGEVNSWPLDEGLIDYVAASYGKSSDENPLYTLNVIANRQYASAQTVKRIRHRQRTLLRQLQQAQGVEANVATGYHAVEFLLWGQDLHGTGPGAASAPLHDSLKGAGYFVTTYQSSLPFTNSPFASPVTSISSPFLNDTMGLSQLNCGHGRPRAPLVFMI